jgi:hypothetical protein
LGRLSCWLPLIFDPAEDKIDQICLYRGIAPQAASNRVPYVNCQTLTPPAFHIYSRNYFLVRNVICPVPAFAAECRRSAAKVLDQPTYTHTEQAIRGAALRPYCPCHLRAEALGGELDSSWFQIMRIDGDSWSAFERRLARERALPPAYSGRGNVLREVTTSSPFFRYTAANQLADGWAGGGLVEISQISASYEVGPAARISLG